MDDTKSGLVFLCVRFFDTEDISGLNKKIKALFLLDECQSIELRDSQIVFEFTKDQDVAVPHTWLQASLAMPARLTLRIRDDLSAPEPPGSPAAEKDPANRAIVFSVEEGYLQVHFSFLLKFFGGKLRDADGSELIYLINDSQKTSRLQLIELTPLGDSSLKIAKLQTDEKKPGILWIDILHADFPGAHDIGISEKTVSFLGTEVELMPDQLIRIGGEAPQKNVEAWNWFTHNIKLFREFAQTGKLATRIDYSRNFGYYFEERKIVMTMGFQASALRLRSATAGP
ncbi:MAG: hypothetical protein Q8R88_00625 [Desulfoprunum sp.]|nr:hypothetical protein [Desulfoprunum sp.]